jgi:O-acetyl-ADP-ribose deacetylase (regulator of RNase III)
MKIKYVKGDLLEAKETYLLHGCNAQGVMGSGVAKAIRAKYPSAYLAYKASEQHNGMRLGVVTYAEQEDGKTVINGITQEFYGRDGKRYVDCDAVREVVQAVDWLMLSRRSRVFELPRVAMPKIGAGLGGGDWEMIEEIIQNNSMYFQPVVYEL